MKLKALAQWAKQTQPGRRPSSDRSLSLIVQAAAFRGMVPPQSASAPTLNGKGYGSTPYSRGCRGSLARREAADDTLRLILGIPKEKDAARPRLKEHFGAIGTIIGDFESGPAFVSGSSHHMVSPQEITVNKPAFTTTTPQRWSKMLMS